MDSASTRGGYCGKSAFDQILSQKGCTRIRYYYAKIEGGVSTLILVGVDSSGMDMFGGAIVDKSWPSPPVCATDSPLSK